MNDAWYEENSGKQRNRAQYGAAPLPNILAGKTPTGVRKRDLLEPKYIIIDTGNSSRRATDEELLHEYRLVQCEGDCQREMKDLGYAPLLVLLNASPVPQTMAEACPTPDTTTLIVNASLLSSSVPTATMVARTSSRALLAVILIITESAEYAFWDGEVHDEEDCQVAGALIRSNPLDESHVI